MNKNRLLRDLPLRDWPSHLVFAPAESARKAKQNAQKAAHKEAERLHKEKEARERKENEACEREREALNSDGGRDGGNSRRGGGRGIGGGNGSSGGGAGHGSAFEDAVAQAVAAALAAAGAGKGRHEERGGSPPRAPRMPETPPSIVFLKRKIRGLKAAAMVGGVDALQRHADAILLVELEDDLARREAKRARYGR